MKQSLRIFIAILLLPLITEAADLKQFLTACAWGTAIGAGVGVVSLAVEDKPHDSWNNVARGASLGLYAGIGYGLYQAARGDVSQRNSTPEFSVIPQIKQGKIEGLEIAGLLYSF